MGPAPFLLIFAYLWFYDFPLCDVHSRIIESIRVITIVYMFWLYHDNAQKANIHRPVSDRPLPISHLQYVTAKYVSMGSHLRTRAFLTLRAITSLPDAPGVADKILDDTFECLLLT